MLASFLFALVYSQEYEFKFEDGFQKVFDVDVPIPQKEALESGPDATPAPSDNQGANELTAMLYAGGTIVGIIVVLGIVGLVLTKLQTQQPTINDNFEYDLEPIINNQINPELNDTSVQMAGL